MTIKELVTILQTYDNSKTVRVCAILPDATRRGLMATKLSRDEERTYYGELTYTKADSP